MHVMKIFVYGLVDPRNLCVMYVGQASDPRARLKGHMSSTTCQVAMWIKELFKDGVEPSLVILQETDDVRANTDEAFWIRSFSARGELLNTVHHCGASTKTKREIWIGSDVSEMANRVADASGIDRDEFLARAVESGIASISDAESAARELAPSSAAILGALAGKASAASLTPEQRKARASAAGKAAALNLTPEQRSERARRAVNARWQRVREDTIRRGQ
jgi:hypothetical protein